MKSLTENIQENIPVSGIKNRKSAQHQFRLFTVAIQSGKQGLFLGGAVPERVKTAVLQIAFVVVGGICQIEPDAYLLGCFFTGKTNQRVGDSKGNERRKHFRRDLCQLFRHGRWILFGLCKSFKGFFNLIFRQCSVLIGLFQCVFGVRKQNGCP